MTFKPGYEDSHLIVAAVRILLHKEGKLPTCEEVADFLEVSPEKVNVLVHELRNLGAVKGLEGPFHLRLDIGDVTLLETLPKDSTGPSIKGELADFKLREKEKREEMERMFRGGEADRRRQDRVSRLEKEFSKFRPKPGALNGLFKASEERAESDPDEDTKEETPGSS